MQASTSVSISFMESLNGTKRTINLHLDNGSEQQDVEVDIPAGIENGAQLLMQDVVRTRQHRVSLVVQVRVSARLCVPACSDCIALMC
jgi:DnaJ-class molecular chaperone